MPIEFVIRNNKPGYRWGKKGKIYTYTAGNKTSRQRAREKALKQGRAIKRK